MSIVSDLTPDVSARPYLTVIPHRTPRQKTHSTLGHAKCAVTSRLGYVHEVGGYALRSDAAIYEWRDNSWSLLWEVPRGTLTMPWQEPAA